MHLEVKDDDYLWSIKTLRRHAIDQTICYRARGLEFNSQFSNLKGYPLLLPTQYKNSPLKARTQPISTSYIKIHFQVTSIPQIQKHLKCIKYNYKCTTHSNNEELCHPNFIRMVLSNSSYQTKHCPSASEDYRC